MRAGSPSPVDEALTDTPDGARVSWPLGLSYGALGAPLAFVSLPLYVNLPHHYASTSGIALATLGSVLLATRLLDAVMDPAFGRLADALLRRSPHHAWRAAVVMAALLAAGFAALWHPNPDTPARTLIWLTGALLLSTLAYSALTILHQTWGTRWNGPPGWRAQISAWREGATLAGVLLASALPYWLGWTATSGMLCGLLGLGLIGLRQPSQPQGSHAPQAAAPVISDAARRNAPSPWRDRTFRHLMSVFLVNGIASAIPATLLPFFVSDRLQAAGALPWLLLSYFGAAVAGLPLWMLAVRRWGLAPSWRAGMLAAVAGFSLTPWLSAGDTLAFAAICVASGFALGADLSLPAALLTGVIHDAGQGGQQEGRYLGWWTCAAKLNLALAAGLALPLLGALGYQSGQSDADSLHILAWTYGGLPCILKLLAAALLWRAERHHPTWRAIA